MQAPPPVAHDGPGPRNASRPGRPRSPDVEARILTIAMEVYARHGWAGLTFERIARDAGVGKGTLYRRWPDRSALLAQVLDARWRSIADIDTGSLRADLIDMAGHVFGLFLDHHGGVMLHLQFDARHHPEVDALLAPTRERLIRIIRVVLTRAYERGELAQLPDIRLFGDMLVGTLNNRMLATPEALKPLLRESATGVIAQLVDVLLSGITPAER